jgi:hypothetical protein
MEKLIENTVFKSVKWIYLAKAWSIGGSYEHTIEISESVPQAESLE